MKKLIALTAGALILTACASTPTSPVIARADATFETTGLGKTKVAAKQNALTAAQKRCGLATPVVIKDEMVYNGVIDERAGRMIEQGIGVVGKVLGTGSVDLSRDDDYEYTMNFKCQ